MMVESVYPQAPLGSVLRQFQEYINAPEPKVYPKLSVKLYGKGVVLDGMADGALLKMKRHQIARAGQVILSEIWGKKGAIGFVPPEGDGALCTSHFFLFDVLHDRLDPTFLQLIFTANYLEDQLGAEARGTTGYAAVRPTQLLAATIPLPALAEQRLIVARVEAMAERIEVIRQLDAQIESDCLRVLSGVFRRLVQQASWKPLGKVSPLIRRPVSPDPFSQYMELGIRSFGKGTFHKAPVTGAELGSKRVFQIHPGDLLFNNVFAWEAAVAVARDEDQGRIGSHRFITCVPQHGIVTAKFLRFFFLTPEGLQLLGAASPGGAGRNRTLGLAALAKIGVPVPDYESQLWFDLLQDRLEAVSQQRLGRTAELDGLLPAVLDRALKVES